MDYSYVDTSAWVSLARQCGGVPRTRLRPPCATVEDVSSRATHVLHETWTVMRYRHNLLTRQRRSSTPSVGGIARIEVSRALADLEVAAAIGATYGD